jgi:hypothetical protein
MAHESQSSLARLLNASLPADVAAGVTTTAVGATARCCGAAFGGSWTVTAAAAAEEGRGGGDSSCRPHAERAKCIGTLLKDKWHRLHFSLTIFFFFTSLPLKMVKKKIEWQKEKVYNKIVTNARGIFFRTSLIISHQHETPGGKIKEFSTNGGKNINNYASLSFLLFREKS